MYAVDRYVVIVRVPGGEKEAVFRNRLKHRVHRQQPPALLRIERPSPQKVFI